MQLSIINFEHNQFDRFDIRDSPVYPTNGRLSFNAFGRNYSLLIRKNMELFSDSYRTEIQRFNESTQRTDKTVHSTTIPQCYYTAEVESDDTGRGLFSACKGRGIRGWISAFGEMIVIRPKLHLTDVTFSGTHKISDDHIVYRYDDLDRSDYPHNHGAICGHTNHEANHTMHMDHTHVNTQMKHTHHQRRRRLQSETTRYVELAVVMDPAMMEELDYDYDFIEDKTISIVAHLQDYYLSQDFGTTVGTIQIVLSAIVYMETFGDLSEPASVCYGSATSPSGYDATPGSNYCEVSYSSYLSNFQNYRAGHLGEYDNAQLFSYYDFESTVIGYASLPGMCISSSSGGIEQCTYDDEYNANIVAHEMGHNFDFEHDGNSNTCSPENYIMASVGNPQGYRPEAFSSCSVAYAETFFNTYTTTLKCLDNKPTSARYGVCGNGFVEEGETCDCGASHCGSVDPCCDGSTCALYASAECSNDDICCSDCTIKASGSVCRELDVDNTCDIEEEYCDGVRSECPPDTKYVEGTICLSDSGDSYGYCYSGSCKAIDDQCQLYGAQSGFSYTIADTSCSGWPLDWQVSDSKCGASIKCEDTNDNACQSLGGEYPDQGIPCNQSSYPSTPSQCVSGICQSSTDVYTYTWTENQWEECNVSCKSSSDEASGYQTRFVECTLQDGTSATSESLCDPNDNNAKPEDGRFCNDYVCDFCAIQPGGLTICGAHGDCNEVSKVCDCDSGWSGAECDEMPSLNWTGITSHTYKDVTTGRTIAEKANPCNGTSDSILASFDNTTLMQTVPFDGVSSLSSLYIGSAVGVRWLTSGDIQQLAVGLAEVDAETGAFITDHSFFPFYVGTSLASDDSSCDDANSTSYDPCLTKLECNDFSFTVPLDIAASTYKLLIRFNNDYNIQSPMLSIACSDNVCNSVGHGHCDATTHECVCDDGYSGSSCSESLCTDWSFALCDRDQFGNCGSTGSTQYKSKCFNSTCSLSSGCGTTCSDPNFEGEYCAIPTDFCSTLLSPAACNDTALSLGSCVWSSVIDKCLYRECATFDNEDACESWRDPSNVTTTQSWTVHDDKWTTFCEWNGEYCNRITCGNDALPQCANGAVRRPIFDYESSDIAISICRAWFCDCSSSLSVGYWRESTAATLLSSISSSYNYLSPTDNAVLSSSYIEDDSIDLFTCDSCSLSCGNGASTMANECELCSVDCPTEWSPFRSGTSCDRAFWIAHFAINIDSSIYMNNQDEFESLMILDLAYFLSSSTQSVSLWQIKPAGDQSIVYFRYLFETNDDSATQATGGDVMYFATEQLQDSTSSAVRGFLMQYSDSNYEFAFCIPSMEECDPSKTINILFIFYICCGSSFGCVILFVLLYRIITRAKRQRAYEQKVRQVRNAQLRLMEHHSKARRVGMRDVSKGRAAKIHKAQRKEEKKQLTEIKERTKQEKILIKQQHHDQLDAPASYSNKQQHNHNDSQLELEQYRRYSAQQEQQQHQQQQQRQYAASVHGMGSYQPPAANNTGQNGMNASQSVYSNALPPDWKIYYNNDGIPYYYNSRSGETTWRRP